MIPVALDLKLRYGWLVAILVAIWIMSTRFRSAINTKAPPGLVAAVPWQLSSQLSRVRRVSFTVLQREIQSKHDIVSEGKAVEVGSQQASFNLPTPAQVFEWIARSRTGPLVVTDSPAKDWPAMHLWYNKTDKRNPYKYMNRNVRGNFTV